MLINNRIEEPYCRLPPEGPLPILSKILVRSKLTQKFFKYTKYIFEPNSIPPDRLSLLKNKENYDKNHNHNIITKKPENNKFNNKNRNSNLKRSKSNDFKGNNLKYLDYQKKINNDNFNTFKKDNFYNSNTFYITNNIKKDDNKNKIHCYNFSNNHDKFNFFEYMVNDNKKEDINCLKEKIIKLEEELDKKEKLIEFQREEKVKLFLKVEELEKIFTSIYPKKKNSIYLYKF